MNTNPDESTLALWLDDELTGEELAAVEAWAASQPEQLAAREEIRQWRKTVATALPAVEEPPYPDFFNSRVMQAIREQTPVTAPSPAAQPAARKSFGWNSWFMPLAACAGMALAFFVGSKTAKTPEIDITANAPRAIPVEPVLYTPEKGVNAEWIANNEASASVIVLNGVAAIPDSMDFSETVMLPTVDESDRTAGNGYQPEFEVDP
ncbi:MAG: hypothetical protein EOP88_11785 [Verrucomicrobiaceae bacterium]|nr:MAG: hypothetical protein EOP88_11785 [Verrucomicrobiaceae bacterium]